MYYIRVLYSTVRGELFFYREKIHLLSKKINLVFWLFLGDAVRITDLD